MLSDGTSEQAFSQTLTLTLTRTGVSNAVRCKLQENHDELGVLLPLKEFEHNILHHLEQVDGIVLRCREEMIHQAGKDSLPL